jgi:sec-independent protein translocase protein TatC
LYENERRYSVRVTLTIYVLFVLGVLLTYFVLFPISFRFLGTYSVAESVTSTITIDSYISSMLSLTLVMGAVFQLPVICFILGKLGLINSSLLARYRRHAFVLLMVIAAIITPPDIMTLVLVSLPLYMLYEVSIWVVKR